MGTGNAPDSIEEDWLGVPMFFSSFDEATNKRLVQSVGFEMVSAEVIKQDEDGSKVEFLWVVARRVDLGGVDRFA
jgi:hypothetical protein